MHSKALRLFALASLAVASGQAVAQAPSARPGAGLPRIVLVDAVGPGPEVEAFIDRLRFEAEDREAFSLVDARLSGASFSALSVEPEGSVAAAFRREWPGTVWLGVNLAGCDPKVTKFSIADTTQEGYRITRTVVNASVECRVDVRRFDAAKPGKPEAITFKGTSPYGVTPEGSADEPMLEAARDAARKAAKKLTPKKK